VQSVPHEFVGGNRGPRLQIRRTLKYIRRAGLTAKQKLHLSGLDAQHGKPEGPGANVKSVSDKGGNTQVKLVPAVGKFVVAMSCNDAAALFSAAWSCGM